MDIAEVQLQNARVNLATDIITRNITEATQDDRVFQAEQEAIAAAQQTEINAVQLGRDQVAARGEELDFSQRFSDATMDRLLNRYGFTGVEEGAVPREGVYPAEVLAGDPESDPRRRSPFHTYTGREGEAGGALVLNPEVVTMVHRLTDALRVSSDSTLDENQLSDLIDGLIFKGETAIQFREGAVIVNGFYTQLDPAFASSLREMVMEARVGSLAIHGYSEEAVKQFMSPDGMSWRSLGGEMAPNTMTPDQRINSGAHSDHATRTPEEITAATDRSESAWSPTMGAGLGGLTTAQEWGIPD
jgi:hypothetical protein